MSGEAHLSEFYNHRDPRDVAAYTASDAAQCVRLPERTVQRWSSGNARLITPARPGRGGLSFNNLVELHVLGALRRMHMLPMPKIRLALDHLRSKLNIERPLLHRTLQTDGVDILVAHLGELVSASADGQIASRPLIERHLARLDWDEQLVARRFYPFTRVDTGADQRRPILVDSRISFGRPVLAGVGVPTRELHERFVAGDSMAMIAEDFGCSADLVEEGIRFEQKAA